MGDAGEALIDAEARIQERMEELARDRAEKQERRVVSAETVQAIESLRLARLDLERQQSNTAHEGRRRVIGQAVAELDRRIADLTARLN
ncbi:MAG: hypothetical protein IT184_15240 [Acidobacteria bacterium]|nr:hypothetical protein [Acidobacteriota bacterium]